MQSSDTPIHVKEFIVILLSIRQWGANWKGQRVVIYCDNDSVCDTCNNHKPKDTKMQMLLREFLFLVCKFNFHPILTKIGTKENYVADLLSRVYDIDLIEKFFKTNKLGIQKRLPVPESWYDFHAEW